jgi:hypothetical protein
MMRSAPLAFALLVLSTGTLASAHAAVQGAYLEARTADLYGGPCTGSGDTDANEAILAWRVDEGAWNGVPLAGLSVVVVLRFDDPLGAGESQGARSVILVDSTAAPEQHAALEELARDSAARVLGEVVRVESAPIQLAVEPSRALARLSVGQLAELATRPFNRLDPLCGDETLAAPPLAAGVDASPAVALRNSFRSDTLGAPWQVANRRGAFVGTFTRGPAPAPGSEPSR